MSRIILKLVRMEPFADAAARARRANPARGSRFMGRDGAGGRVVAAALGGGTALALYMTQLVASALATETFRNDFRLYLGAALVGLHHGFANLYDLDLQRQVVEGLAGGGNYQPFVSPPLAAWLAVPLAGVPFRAGVWAWTAMLVLCLVLTWWTLAPGARGEKLAHLVVAAGFLPLAFALSVGQLAPVIGLAIALAFVFLRSGRPYVAGVVLVVAWLKPQDALLVAPALLVSGRLRCFAGWVCASAVLGALTITSLGWHGVAQYSSALSLAGQWDLMRRYALPGQPFWGPFAPLVPIGPVLLTAALARRHRHDLGLVMAAGLSGSLLVSPYLGVQDLCLLLPAAWLVWRGGIAGWHLALATAVYGTLELSLVLGPLPVLVAELSWLAALWFVRSPAAERPATPSQGTGPAPGRPGPQPAGRAPV